MSNVFRAMRPALGRKNRGVSVSVSFTSHSKTKTKTKSHCK
jgi:hypothetical protein